MNILGMGPLEIVVILLLAFIFLGPERMTDAARLLARAIREGRNLASSIPRVVLEDDEIKVVDRGKSTSLIRDRPPQPAEPPAQDAAEDTPESDGPVPFSREAATSQKTDAADSRADGRPQ